MQRNERTPWIATLHVRPMPGRTGGLEGNPAGAYAIVLALVQDEAHYREMVASEMENLGLFIVAIENVGPYHPHPEDAENICMCAARLSSEWPVQYHDFHTYPHDDA